MINNQNCIVCMITELMKIADISLTIIAAAIAISATQPWSIFRNSVDIHVPIDECIYLLQ